MISVTSKRLLLSLLLIVPPAALGFSSSLSYSSHRRWFPNTLVRSRTCSTTSITAPVSFHRSNYYYRNTRRFETTEDVYIDAIDGTTTVTTSKDSATTSQEEGEELIYKNAIRRTLQYAGLTALFGIGLWNVAGGVVAEEFFAGYLVEQSLSVDNLFVFLVLFDYFKVPMASQERVLGWGIFGAVVMRTIMVALGAAALHNFHAILLVFASILVYSSGKILLGGEDDDEDEDMSSNGIIRFSRRLIDSTDEYDGDRFFTLVNGVRKATPLLICMIALEISDIVFAVDSIPAVFGVTENPMIVLVSNIFAILGLRSLYTILSKAASDLKYLEPSVAIVLGFIGAKMIAEYFGVKIPTEVALPIVASVLGGGVMLSMAENKQEEEEEEIRNNSNNDNDDSST